MAMEWWWWIVPAAVAVFGVAFVLSGLGWMFRGKPFKGGRGVVSGSALLAIGAVITLLGMNVQTYNRLSKERPVATIALASNGDRSFTATVTELKEDGTPAAAPRTYEIEGDQWQVDARVISWKPWANVIGLDSQYELQRIWGRNIVGPNRNTARAEDLVVERPGLDFLAVSEGLGRFSPVDVKEREFGSAVFMPMVDGAVYQVRITQEALAVDASNDIARGAIAAGALARGALEAAGIQPALPQSTPAPAAP
jgi:hypothetical protein